MTSLIIAIYTLINGMFMNFSIIKNQVFKGLTLIEHEFLHDEGEENEYNLGPKWNFFHIFGTDFFKILLPLKTNV